MAVGDQVPSGARAPVASTAATAPLLLRHAVDGNDDLMHRCWHRLRAALFGFMLCVACSNPEPTYTRDRRARTFSPVADRRESRRVDEHRDTRVSSVVSPDDEHSSENGRVIDGRVITPSGDPVVGAQVQVIGRRGPHEAETVLHQTAAGADGSFSFANVRSASVISIVVRGNGGERTFSLDSVPGQRAGPVEIRVAPTRRTHVRLDCLAEPDPRDVLATRLMAPRVSVFWLPGRDLITHRAMDDAGHPAVLPNDGESMLRPGRQSDFAGMVSTTARRFSRTIDVPAGHLLLAVTGACGVGTREIEVRDGVAIPEVVFNLPTPDSFNWHRGRR